MEENFKVTSFLFRTWHMKLCVESRPSRSIGRPCFDQRPNCLQPYELDKHLYEHSICHRCHRPPSRQIHDDQSQPIAGTSVMNGSSSPIREVNVAISSRGEISYMAPISRRRTLKTSCSKQTNSRAYARNQWHRSKGGCHSWSTTLRWNSFQLVRAITTFTLA